MNKGAIISECGQYRYQLWRIWNPDKPTVLFICLNPSTADANIDDPTVRRLIGFAGKWGFGGFYLGNLFSYRSTSPVHMRVHIEPIGPENDHHLQLLASKCTRIVFAWGNDGNLHERSGQIAEMFPGAFCLGKTNSGQPKHPLYLSKSTELIPFK